MEWDWTAILVSAAAGGLVLYVWYAIAWMGLQHHKADYRAVKDPAGLTEAIRGLEPVSAMYAIPHMDEYAKGMSDPDLDKRMREGPNACVIVYPAGPAMTGGTFLRGFVINVFEALLCVLLFALAAQNVTGFLGHVLFSVAFGLGSVASYFALSNWARFPWRFTWASTFDRVVGFALLGVVLYFLGPAGTVW